MDGKVISFLKKDFEEQGLEAWRAEDIDYFTRVLILKF